MKIASPSSATMIASSGWTFDWICSFSSAWLCTVTLG